MNPTDFHNDWLSRWAMYSPEKIALSTWPEGESISYGALNNWAQGLVQLFRAKGVRKGDRVAILADFCLEYGALIGAVQKSGIVLVPINYRLSPKEVGYIVSDCSPSILIYEKKYESLATEITEAGCSLMALEALSSASQSSQKIENTAIAEDDSAFILYTSGTTGFPKGALYSHNMLLWNSLNTLMRLNLTQDDKTVLCMPPFHTGGINVLLTPLLHLGGSVVLMKKFDPLQVLNALEDSESTIFMGVPTMLRMMADSPAFELVKLNKLRYFIVGGEAMPVPLIELWDKKGVPIRQGFGMTEVGPNLFSLHQDDAIRKKGSIGKPNFYVEVRLMKDDGTVAAPGERGELQLRGPVVSPGYWHNEEGTQKAFTDGGWFKTGDVLVMDEEGYFFVVDRIKNMYISGGENVYPAEVERVIQQMPEVKEVLVIGVPHPKWGETGKACIALQTGKQLNDETVRAFCQKHLAKFKVPGEVSFYKELPKNATGKIDRKQLQSS